MPPKKPKTIDEYLATVAVTDRTTLQKLRKTIHSIVPAATECISYGIPAFRVEGGVVAGFCARREGCSYLPFSGSTFETLASELQGYEKTKSSLHFSSKKPLPVALVRTLIQTRLAEIDL